MRKLNVFILIVTLLLFSDLSFSQSNIEKVTKDIVNAYRTKDASLLKQYVAGFFAIAINDNFFESSDGKPLVKIAQDWDGTVKEIRYSKGDMMGKTVLLASAHISNNPNGNLNVVILSSYEGADWKAFALGISDISKAEFEEGTKDIPVTAVTEKTKYPKSDYSEFSIEMASGDKYEKPTLEKLNELLKNLNDDNFFLILNSKNDFLQASTSEKGYIVQYSDETGMFEAIEYFSLESLIDIFTSYMNKEEWKGKAKWVTM